MLIHKTFNTNQEKQAIIEIMMADTFTQVSIEGLYTGKGHLLFDDGRPAPKPIRDYGKEIDELKAKIDKLKVA